MCRFLGYLGSEILLADLISNPANSLIRQSYKSKERSEPLNGDGFGVGWYSPAISNEACVFTSITPAWNNRNLLNLVEHIRSPCFSLTFAPHRPEWLSPKVIVIHSVKGDLCGCTTVRSKALAL